MPLQNEISASVVPQAYTLNTFDNVVTTIKVRGYSQFDPFSGVTAQVCLYNVSNQIIKMMQIRITGDDWQNWPASNTPEEDNNYVMGVILNKLGYTKV